MRKIYLLRHGQPDFPQGVSRCISSTDLPLSLLGRMQGVLLGKHLEDIPLSAVYHTGMRRTAETAAYLSNDSQTAMGLQELGMGLWENLTFAQIREQWPTEYRLRGEDPSVNLIPGAEALPDCLHRSKTALLSLLDQTQRDIALVAHAGVNRLLLADLLGLPQRDFLSIPQPYGSVNVLQYDGRLQADSWGIVPRPPLDGPLCEALLQTAQTPDHVRRHCRAVARKAVSLAFGLGLDTALLQSAALLHDILRSQPCHAAAGADLLCRLGYPDTAHLVRTHNDLPEDLQLDEKCILYLADKLILGDREVALKDRFSVSAVKCKTPEALAAHRLRFDRASQLLRLWEQQTGCGAYP